MVARSDDSHRGDGREGTSPAGSTRRTAPRWSGLKPSARP